MSLRRAAETGLQCIRQPSNAILYELTNSSAGTATLSQDANRAGTFATTAATAVTYVTATNGRTVVTTGGTSNQVVYLYNTGAGFGIDQAATSRVCGPC